MISFRNSLTIDEIFEYAVGQRSFSLAREDEAFQVAIGKNREYFYRELHHRGDIYGATTGFGGSSQHTFSPELGLKLQSNLISYHGCGVGEPLSEGESAATLLIRLNCLTWGYSGVSFDLLEHLGELVEKRIFPLIPSQGSVGASGDLTPLSYVAACLEGKRRVYYRGSIRPTAEVFRELGIKPYRFKEREALAVMNGTAVMSAIAALASHNCRRLADIACMLSGLMVELLKGRTAPFMEELNLRKPHPGALKAAKKIFSYLNAPFSRLARREPETKDQQDPHLNHRRQPYSIQDRYSLRCAPGVIGVVYDALEWSNRIITTEINSTNDNPVFLDELELTLNGGLFFGGHIAAACDALKSAVANTVNLIDRQLALLLDQGAYEFVGENLVPAKLLGNKAPIHHGFKGMQITLSALAAEIQKSAMPMAIFSRPTEASNQDVVSMGTIAARDLAKIVVMAQNALAIHAMALRQGFFILEHSDKKRPLNPPAREALEQIAAGFEPVIEDRALDYDIEVVRKILFDKWDSR